jgi:hypothetical protein
MKEIPHVIFKESYKRTVRKTCWTAGVTTLFLDIGRTPTKQVFRLSFFSSKISQNSVVVTADLSKVR